MNDSEKSRLEAIEKSLKRHNPGYKHVFGGKAYTAKKLIKKLREDPEIRQMYFDMLDGYAIAELVRDAARRQ